MAGHSINVAALFERLRHANQRAAIHARLDYQQTVAPPADDSIAHRKRLAVRLDLHREFRNDGAASAANFFRQGGVFGRIQFRQPRADHRDGASFRGERALMRRGIDAARETADDREAGVG